MCLAVFEMASGEVRSHLTYLTLSFAVKGEHSTSRGLRTLTKVESGRLNVENHYFDVPDPEEDDHFFSKTIAAASNDHKLFLPIPLMILPIVKRLSVQRPVQESRNSNVREHFEPFRQFSMPQRKVLSFAGVAR